MGRVAVPFFIGKWLGLEPVALAVLIVQVATPVAVTSYLLAQKYGANADEVAGLWLAIIIGIFAVTF